VGIGATAARSEVKSRVSVLAPAARDHYVVTGIWGD
jgi:hypothetical protein